MKKLIATSLSLLAFCCASFVNAQSVKQSQWTGVPCADCVSPQSTQKGNPNTVQNGNGTVATSYTVSACGLGFVTATQRLNQRAFTGMTTQKGVLQPATFNISGIPPCFTIVKAFLYTGGSGNGVAITANITNPLAVAGAYPMTMIGSHTDKCWGYTGTYNYRADVTAAISGNGNYIISGIPCLGTTPNDMDGATLIVMYTDPTQTFTGHMVIGDGCREVSGGAITNTLTGFSVCGAANSTQNFVIVSDLQQIAATPINFNSATSNYTFASASNTVWDYIQQPGAPATAGQTSAIYGFSNSSDCYNFVAAGMYYRTACQVCTAASNLTVTAVTSSSCAAGSATASVTGGTGPYSYTWSPTGGNTATITGASTGNYTVTVKDATGCKTGTAVVAINSAAAPTISIASATTICAGSSANLTASGASTYTWSPGATLNTTTGPNVVATPPTTQVYSVSGTSTAGCIGTQTVQVTVNPIPVPIIGSNSPVCLGAPINLTSGGGTTYSWTGPNAFSSALQNPTIPAAALVNAGVYTVNVTSLGCSKTATVSVTVTTPTTSASNTGPYCQGATIQLNSPTATSYTWSGPSAFSSNAQNPTIANATPAMSGTYTISASTGACVSTATTLVTVNPLPVPAPTNTGPYCPGNTIQLNVGAFSTYTWSGPSSFSSNAQNPTVSNAQTTNGGVYTVIVSSAAGCTNTANTTVVVNPSPVIVIGSNSPVCINTSINLTSTGGGTYSWTGPSAFASTLQNPTVPSATPVNAGVYTVTVTNLGCTSTASVNVIVTTPTTSASNTGPYCAGTTINLSAPAATSYTWSGPGGYTSNSQNATQPSSTPAMSGTYSVIVSIGTCTASATTNVVVNALPTPTATSNSPLCAGQTINLTGAGALTYTWSGPGSFSSNSATPSIPTASVSNGGNYVLTVTDANGCKNTASVVVVVNALPTISVSNPTTCVNTTINLTSTGGVTYSWTGPGGFTSAAQNPNIPAAQLTMSGVYVVTVTDANGCINTANANVSVLPLPSPNITSNSPVCAGQTLNLFGTGGAVYAWSGPGYVGASQNPVINNVTAAANGVYTLLVSSGTCTASTTYTVVINPVPVFSFAGSNVLCNGQSNGTSTVNVTVGTGPFTYQWSTIPTQNSQAASSLPAGTYSCIVTDANNCTSVASTQITQPTQFSVAINTATFSACANTPINVNAIGAGGTGPYTYNWVLGPATSPYSVNETVAGNYIYTVNAVDAFNCPATANINLTFFPQPTVTATSATLCAGQSTAVLVATGATSYIWQPGNITGSTYPYSGNTSVNVTVVGTSNGCSNSTNAAVIVNPVPSANISVSNVTGCVPACLTFTAGGASNITSYGWMLNGAGITGAQNGGYCFDEPASYTLGLQVMDANGCTGTVVPVVVNIYPQPVADFNHAPIKPIINQDPFVTFTDASYNANIVSWNWYFMNTAQYTSTQQNPTFAYSEPGTYPVVLVVKSDKGCSDTLVRPVVVGEDFGIYVPNAFTPNADGMNDIFQPKGFGVVKYELNIFDRWGEKVFSTKTFEEGWDGSFLGRGQKTCEEGAYTWLINCTSVFGKSHELKGHVTLMK